jgi:hypothetical protein
MEDDSSYNGCQVENFNHRNPRKDYFFGKTNDADQFREFSRSTNFAACHVASFLATLLMLEVLFVKEFYP